MAMSLLKYEKLKTTTGKAKSLRGFVEKLITLGKRGDLNSRRNAARFINDKDIVYKLFSKISKRFMSRNGGYTRVIKSGFRNGDNAPLSIIELLPEENAVK